MINENVEYLKLFNNLNKEEKYEMLKETPQYDNLEKLYETPIYKESIKENVNDGWNDKFHIEKVINGRKLKNDPNGLNQFLDPDDLREDYRGNNKFDNITSEQLNEKIDFSNMNIVDVNTFNMANNNCFIQVGNEFKKIVK